ncbi:hypothetical protein CRYUN_Cryun26dG0086700 [Craigia yunnanensis]
MISSSTTPPLTTPPSKRIAEAMDFEIKCWAAGKEGNMRALLSSLQQVLWSECGWEPVSLTDLITSVSIKTVYRKATLCVHPDKVQQKGATIEQKYIAEKVFDILKVRDGTSEMAVLNMEVGQGSYRPTNVSLTWKWGMEVGHGSGSELSRPENKGFSAAMSLLDEAKKEIDSYSKGGPISYADLIQYAAQGAVKATFLAAAIRKCGGNEEKGRTFYAAYGSNGQWGLFGRQFGRSDTEESDPEGRVPLWEKANVQEIKDKFKAIGFGPRQINKGIGVDNMHYLNDGLWKHFIMTEPSSVDQKIKFFQFLFCNLRNSSEDSKQSSKSYQFGPFAPVNLTKFGNSENNVKRVHDWESLATTYCPQYHNQGRGDNPFSRSR